MAEQGDGSHELQGHWQQGARSVVRTLDAAVGEVDYHYVLPMG